MRRTSLSKRAQRSRTCNLHFWWIRRVSRMVNSRQVIHLWRFPEGKDMGASMIKRRTLSKCCTQRLNQCPQPTSSWRARISMPIRTWRLEQRKLKVLKIWIQVALVKTSQVSSLLSRCPRLSKKHRSSLSRHLCKLSDFQSITRLIDQNLKISILHHHLAKIKVLRMNLQSFEKVIHLASCIQIRQVVMDYLQPTKE